MNLFAIAIYLQANINFFICNLLFSKHFVIFYVIIDRQELKQIQNVLSTSSAF